MHCDLSKVLVTGGAGFIGSHLVDRYLKNSCEVTILDNLSTGSLENVKPHLDNVNLRFVRGDLRDKRVMKEALKDVKAVFHLAAISSIPFSVKNPGVTNEVNLNATKNLLEMSIHHDIAKLIYASTCAVYGDPIYLPIDEEHPRNPKSPYAETKLKAEQECIKSRETYGLGTTILRLFNVYGPRQRSDQDGGVIAQFINQLRNNKPPIVYGDGSQTRDFVHVDDVVQAFVLALNNNTDSETPIFNIASGKPTSINELARILIYLFGNEEVKLKHLETREGEINHSYANIKKAEAILGYKPKNPIKEGLSALLHDTTKN